jgi:hypothetical protein
MIKKKIFLIYKENQLGAAAESYIRNGFLMYEEMRKYLVIYTRRLLVIYDFATAPFWISLYIRNFFLSFLSVKPGPI